MIRTSNLKARNATGVLVNSHEGRKVSGINAISGKQLDSVQEETHVVSTTEPIVVKKHNRPSLLQTRRYKLTEEHPRKVLASGESPSGLKGRKAFKKFFKFVMGIWHHVEILEVQGPSQGIMLECETYERYPCALNFEERTLEERCTKKDAPAKQRGTWRKNVDKLKNDGKATFYSL